MLVMFGDHAHYVITLVFAVAAGLVEMRKFLTS